MSYKYKVGDKGKTRDGTLTYEVLRVLHPNNHLLVVLISENGREISRLMYPAGTVYNGPTHTDDLMPPTRTIYLNIYPENYSIHGDWACAGYNTEAQAKLTATNEAIKVAFPVEISLE